MPREKKKARKLYLQKNVLEAAQERIRWIFSEFKTVVVSVSGGKDSSTLFDLSWKIAQELNREINLFFLDEEVVYRSTIDIIRDQCSRPGVIPHWWQSPYKTTNATSYEQPLLHVWGPGETWMREKEDIAFKDEVPIARHSKNKDAFYHMAEYAEQQWSESTAILIGLRSEESLNRYGAVTRNPALPNVPWSSKSTGKAVKLYPIYDWTFEDIWTYLGTENVPYNRVYDWMYAKGHNIPEMRVSSLIHERAHRCLCDLQEFEPDTYANLLKRVPSVHVAQLYAKDNSMMKAQKLPRAYDSWKDYRDFIMGTLPLDVAQPFKDRFAGQMENEAVWRQQVRQLQINDQENLVPVQQTAQADNPKEKWMKLL